MVMINLEIFLNRCLSFSTFQELNDKTLSLTTFTTLHLQVSDLLPILHACKPSSDTDYYKLNSVITLIDLGVGNEPLKSLEKEDLDRLIWKLRELTGDIKDSFKIMNRTQVKDLMLRTVNKMTVLSQSMQSKQVSGLHTNIVVFYICNLMTL